MNGTRPDDRSATLDPRIRRSRRMLADALARLMLEKDFDKISIQEIAEAATLNRATFYDHYPDKFSLLHCLIGTRFAESMARRDVRVSECRGAMRAIALGVCDFLAEVPVSAGRSHEGSVQIAIVDVVAGMLAEGLGKTDSSEDLPTAVLASAIAWTIYGAARGWMQHAGRCSAERMAEVIERLVEPMLKPAGRVA